MNSFSYDPYSDFEPASDEPESVHVIDKSFRFRELVVGDIYNIDQYRIEVLGEGDVQGTASLRVEKHPSEDDREFADESQCMHGAEEGDILNFPKLTFLAEIDKAFS